MTTKIVTLLLASVGIANSQGIGNTIPEVHPILSTQKCTVAGGCIAQNTRVVADSQNRPLHMVGDLNKSCNPNPNTTIDNYLIDASICPDAATCGRNCQFEGIDYESVGVTTNGSALTMRMFMPNATTGGYDQIAPRLYLLAEDDMNYESIRLLDQELTFDVDMSLMPCGTNAALYLDEMSMSGSRSEYNVAGAAYGTGYCDAQCYNKTFVNAEPNLDNRGACCHEMDIWEANGLATALTPHPCAKPGPFSCTGDECGRGDAGLCDHHSCQLNPYKTIGHDYYGPGLAVDTSRPFTVVTQFWTQNNSRTMSEIRRFYIQDGRTLAGENTLTTAFCSTNGTEPRSPLERVGGFEAMGGALDRGMVLIFSIWDAVGDFMNWLDAGAAGPCGPTDGDPAKVLADHPDTALTFSNIRWGDIGSTTTTPQSPPRRK